MVKLPTNLNDSPLFNRGTLAGLLTVFTGVLDVISAVGGVPPGTLTAIVAILSGAITTKDSINSRLDK